jgi:thiol-disulfide isomerase/thioredoxin
MKQHRTTATTFATILAGALALGGCATTGPLGRSAATASGDASTAGAAGSAMEALRANEQIAARSGKVVVVAFYATWCPAARKMLRAVADLSRKRGDQGLVVMAVAEDEDAAAAESFAHGVGLAGPVTLDRDGELARRLKLTTVPALVVVGRDGAVGHVHAGYRGAETAGAVEREVAALLGAPRPERDREVFAATENDQ